jgi:hypothetical protein
MYRAEALRLPEIDRLNTLSRNALETLLRVFPYGVTSKKGGFSLLILHGDAALDDALGGQLSHCGPHPDHLHQRDRDPDEVGRQDQGAQDQQPGFVRWQPPQEQHGGEGCDGAVAALGRDRFDPSLHHLRV